MTLKQGERKAMYVVVGKMCAILTSVTEVQCHTTRSRDGMLDLSPPPPPPPPRNPENQFENRAKFLCLKGKWRITSLFLHQKCFNVHSSGHKEPQNCNHLMLVDANCDDSVTIPRCPNLVVDLKVSVALKKKVSHAYVGILCTPLFQSLDALLGGGGGGGGVLPGCMDINFFAAVIDSNCAVFKNNCIDLIIEMLWHCSESDSILLLKCCHFQSSGVGTTVAGAVLLFGANTR